MLEFFQMIRQEPLNIIVCPFVWGGIFLMGQYYIDWVGRKNKKWNVLYIKIFLALISFGILSAISPQNVAFNFFISGFGSFLILKKNNTP